ncbi:MAG TPA: HupE/UreJ family protein [Bacteroidetes bacterium]|nr:HupE/UreJ family protein [Bacteroidota bacterium]
MSEFSAFLQLGFDHISDLQAYDHLLFIITLCAVYQLKEWKKILILVTAFTIGHSTTLALSALDIIRVPTDLVELLIPITILLTSLHNVWAGEKKVFFIFKNISANYFLALFFGTIHGMGFANYFRNLFGGMGNIIKPLFAFNLGIEAGQLMIVLLFFSFYFLLSKMFKIKHREWTLYISGAGAGVALILILDNLLGG